MGVDAEYTHIVNHIPDPQTRRATQSLVGFIVAESDRLDKKQQDGVQYSLDCYDLGKPAVQNTAGIVADGDMKVGAYTIAAQPDVPRSLAVTVVKATGNDTMGTLTFTGTDYVGNALVEVLAPNNGDTSSGYKETINAFKTVSSIVGADWVISAPSNEDQIQIGLGKKLGLPVALASVGDMPLGILNNAIQAHNRVVVDPPTVAGTTVDMSAGTYNATKIAQVLVLHG